MKNKQLVFSLTLLFFVCGTRLAIAQGDSTSIAKKELKAFLVIELFTAEGCAACLPADELILQKEKEAEKEGSSIYFLNYHVGYWDYLGWKDVLADKKFEAHQDYYSSYFPNAKSYTPQLVVNGTNEFTGSDDHLLRRSVEDAMQHPKENYFLEVKANKKDTAYVTVVSQLSSIPANCQLQIALVEKNLSPANVKSGENKGVKINRYSAVRLLETIPNPQLKNRIDLKFSSKNSLNKTDKKFSVVIYLQDKDGREIYSVEAVDLKL